MDNYSVLYQSAASLIPQESKVVELGCGAGKFANEFIKGKFKTYVGFDIDEEAVKKASENSLLKFSVADITHLQFFEPGFTFVALEVFEHLSGSDDLRLLGQLVKGTRVIFSVPSFDAADHKIFWPGESDAIEYYEDTLDIDFWRKIRIPTGGGYFHLMRGYR